VSRAIRFGFCKRCDQCEKPLIFLWKEPEHRLVPVEAADWEGSIYYIKGLHKPHWGNCPEFHRWLKEKAAAEGTDMWVDPSIV
jgi:hypothetical protein